MLICERKTQQKDAKIPPKTKTFNEGSWAYSRKFLIDRFSPNMQPVLKTFGSVQKFEPVPDA